MASIHSSEVESRLLEILESLDVAIFTCNVRASVPCIRLPESSEVDLPFQILERLCQPLPADHKQILLLEADLFLRARQVLHNG